MDSLIRNYSLHKKLSEDRHKEMFGDGIFMVFVSDYVLYIRSFNSGWMPLYVNWPISDSHLYPENIKMEIDGKQPGEDDDEERGDNDAGPAEDESEINEYSIDREEIETEPEGDDEDDEDDKDDGDDGDDEDDEDDEE
ncbi:hypothetical protein N7481_000584 [Penicillium waksmanii]|uniref:uncharacterized protein n=1 Tax=Penicillium waksmanii TaxID=69791 RepID=UPI002547A2C7|nr:uncharacterized protein N7481_000584 [Penicillium waksmanii]KAJ6000175.1 hypothetical protein N7481_000584 [Penicillium waksmanii]